MVRIEPFGSYNNEPVYRITLENKEGMKVKCITLGCTITEVHVKDRSGIFENVVCGFQNIENYLQHQHFFGAAIGPFAGRLERAIVQVNGKNCETTPNDGDHLLHGGNDGFHSQNWSFVINETDTMQSVRFSLTKKYDNFPGNIQMTITYKLTDSNTFVIDYSGVTDEKTLLNATNHSYFNLSGDLKRSILQHRLQLEADAVLYIDEQGLPIPEKVDINNSPFIFPTVIQDIVEQQHEQIKRASFGIDHPFILKNRKVVLSEKASGRMLTIETDQFCAVIYSGQKIGTGYKFSETEAQNFSGICIEVQNIPNSVLYPHLPNSILKPNEKYTQTTSYYFSIVGE